MSKNKESIFENQLSVSGKKWIIPYVDEQKVLAYKQKHDLPEVVARILVVRDIQEHEIESFLHPTIKHLLPNPWQLKDMDLAIERIIKAIKNNQKIAIFGDYDVDGATSSALLYKYFTALGLEVEVYIPDRVKEGYGPNTNALQKLQANGNKLVITVDCGTTSFDAIEYANKINLDIIIIDHHISESKLPNALAIINPNRIDHEKNDCKHCAAVGVAFIFLVALQQKITQLSIVKHYPDLFSYLDLVTTGTICDVVPLRGINRAYVTQGLKVFAKHNNIGLSSLYNIAGINESPNAYHIGFLIGPRINAGGRVGESSLGVKILSTSDRQQAAQIATQLSLYNDERKQIEQEIIIGALNQAERQKNSPVIIVYSKKWHQGVIGIAASRIKEKYNRPTFVITYDDNGIGKGSARSVPGLDIGNLVHSAKQNNLLVNGGGHAMAAGLTINQEKLSEFSTFITEKIIAQNIDLTPQLEIDACISIAGANIDFLDKLEMLAPYGQGNTIPRFLLNKVNIIRPSIIGKNHIKCILQNFGNNKTISAIAFRAVDTTMGELLLNSSDKWFSIVGALKINEWNGTRKVQFIIEDIMQTILK